MRDGNRGWGRERQREREEQTERPTESERERKIEREREIEIVGKKLMPLTIVSGHTGTHLTLMNVSMPVRDTD